MGKGRRRTPQPGRTVARVVTSSLLALGLVTGLGVVLLYNNWNGNIRHVEPPEWYPRPPAAAGKQVNVLVMGSDSRAGKGNGIDGEAGGGLSDTTILFHLSADRKRAYGVSIPRDTAVMRPTCYEDDGTEIPGSSDYVKWNEAFKAGGPFCTMHQFEELSGIRVDHYLLVDFNQFKDMVDALDGVEVCLPQDIDDDEHDVHLEEGTRELHGDQALDYVRVRYGISGGIDPNRTRRQQAFIGSMISKAVTGGVLARPDRLSRFINAATSSLQSDLKLAQLVNLGTDARGVGPENIKFVTTPWTFSDKVSSGIEWTPRVDELWRLLREDRPLTSEFLKDALSAADKADGRPGPGKSAGATTSADPAAEPTAGSSATPPGGASDGLDTDGRAAAGLCS